MTHDDDRLASYSVFAVHEPAAERRLNAESLEVVAAHILQADLFHRELFDAEGDCIGIGGKADELFERMLFSRQPPIEKCRDRRALIPPFANRAVFAVVVGDHRVRREPLVGPFDDHQRIGILHRQRLQERRIDQAEDRRVRAQADGEREHDGE